MNIEAAIKIIVGVKPDGYYLAGFFFSFLAILLSLYMYSKTRDKHSQSTPYNFSWWFLLWDNIKRITAGMIVMFILFRVADLSNIYAMLSVGFAVAFSLDKVIQTIMDKSNILDFLQPDRKK